MNINPWYKDRDFPEVKESNADIVAYIPRTKDLERVIRQYNALIDIIDQKNREIRDLKDIVKIYHGVLS
jgi:hypothetical protein